MYKNACYESGLEACPRVSILVLMELCIKTEASGYAPAAGNEFQSLF